MSDPTKVPSPTPEFQHESVPPSKDMPNPPKEDVPVTTPVKPAPIPPSGGIAHPRPPKPGVAVVPAPKGEVTPTKADVVQSTPATARPAPVLPPLLANQSGVMPKVAPVRVETKPKVVPVAGQAPGDARAAGRYPGKTDGPAEHRPRFPVGKVGR